MERFDRIYELHKLLRAARRPISMASLCETLGCSKATTKRLIQSMRLYLGAPIDYDREYNGYYYAQTGEEAYELPGMWFSAAELHALLTADQLLRDLGPGLLDGHLEPLRQRIQRILHSEQLGSGTVASRVRLIAMGARPAPEGAFGIVAGALSQRRRLRLRYHSRERDETTERAVSPQRLIHYRDNWYLDAWCHLRAGLRSFALDRILLARTLDEAALELGETDLDAHFASAYGIFAGQADKVAVLQFTPARARWVADERWHPDQEGRYLPDGAYELRLPYRDPRELIMDILRHGAEVEVIAPADLRNAVAAALRAATAQYASTDTP